MWFNIIRSNYGKIGYKYTYSNGKVNDRAVLSTDMISIGTEPEDLDVRVGNIGAMLFGADVIIKYTHFVYFSSKSDFFPP